MLLQNREESKKFILKLKMWGTEDGVTEIEYLKQIKNYLE